jgi:flavin reductase (DIM6/NTAB) family NADH-FMN oxidoreductase RutF
MINQQDGNAGAHPQGHGGPTGFMEFDFENGHAVHAFDLLSGLVVPRPIALVTTISPDGQVNAAPFSFFNVLGDAPPIVALAPGDRADGTPKDTALNIRLTREFVVNLVDEGLAHAMNRCAASLPYGENELKHAGLTAVTCSVVRPPRIAEAPASLECVEWSTLHIGDNRLVIGIVKRLHAKDGIVEAGSLRVRLENYHPIARMQGQHWYCRTRDMFELIKPD